MNLLVREAIHHEHPGVSGTLVRMVVFSRSLELMGYHMNQEQRKRPCSARGAE